MIERLSFNIAVDITGILGLFFMTLSFADRALFQDGKRQRLLSIYITLMAVLATDMVACIFRGKPEMLLLLDVVNTAYFVLNYMLLLIFVSYMRHELNLKSNQWRIPYYVIYVLAVGMMLASLLNPVHHYFFEIEEETGLYHRNDGYWLTTATTVIMLVSMCKILIQRDVPWAKRLSLVSFCVLPLLVVMVQHFFYGLSMTNLAALCSALIIYAGNYVEQNQAVSKKEMELQNTRAALVLSQIQPHFLFNSMAAVMDLCDTDPQEAKDALQELSDYLHYKISAMSNSYVVPFQEDLDFLQNYLKLEKRRFHDRLRVEYDIQATDFQIPLLTLQPLVENAIRHGISKRPSGGTIRVHSWENSEYCSILVEDDGVGFDTSGDYDTDGLHVGLANVRTRLAALCGGTLTIRSSLGTGTAVEITIRKKREEKRLEYSDRG